MYRRYVVTGFATLLTTVACQSGDVLTNGSDPGLRPSFALSPTTEVVQVERFKLCKHGSAATFDYTIDGGSVQSETLADGDCVLVHVAGGAVGGDVSVTEDLAALPVGYVLDHVDVTTLSNGVVSTTTIAGPTVNGHIQGTQGVLAVYYNRQVETGGQGCTPGYWKQEQHFDSWTAPYAPTDLFSAYFEDAFPGMTLLDVLKNGGGGLDALGRHTVAALLNAAANGVNYGMTPQQVIDAFNAVFPGTKDDYTTLKDQFAGANESGCPLN